MPGAVSFYLALNHNLSTQLLYQAVDAAQAAGRYLTATVKVYRNVYKVLPFQLA